jgi:chemosensory pili system protein ChpA (sensor histidine kinase/response regulator)
VAVVVDDSLSARRALAELMQDMGYEVHAARDGIEAAELLDQHGADIVLADLEMPRMNGLELAAHMRGQAALKDIPIVMVTSRSTEKHRQQAAAVGVNVYMTKPFTEDELARHVEQLVTPAAGRDDGDAANSTEHGVR